MNFLHCEGTVYNIRRGDTLYSISRRYNIPLAMLLRANPFADMYNLQIGDEICIPILDRNNNTSSGGSNRVEFQRPMPTPAATMATGATIPTMPTGETAQAMPTTPTDRTTQAMPTTPTGRTAPTMPTTPTGGTAPTMPTTPTGRTTPARPTGGTTPNIPEGTLRPTGATVPMAPTGVILPMRPAPTETGGSTMPNSSRNQERRSNTSATMPQNQNNNANRRTVGTQRGRDNIIAYVVRDTDTLQDILDQFNMDFEQLLTYNDMNDIMLKPGSTINVIMRENMNGNRQ